MSRVQRLLTAVLIVIAAGAATADPRKFSVDDPVSARLISSVDELTPGVPFTLGVLLSIEDGWHLYWKYAGDAGLPPKITWELPPDWKIGEVQWPMPQRFIEKGPLTTYGYSDVVALLVTVTPPATLSDRTAALSAKAKWFVCHDECIPGGADIRITYPVRSGSSASDAGIIKQWQSRLPASLAQTGIRATSSLRSKDSVGRSGQLTLTIKGGSRGVVPVDWFPAPTSDFAVRDIKTTAGTDSLRIECEIHSYRKPLAEIGALESLIICDAAGKRISVTCVTSLKEKSS
jgi:thiol:disulfide interchange protein DsbD